MGPCIHSNLDPDQVDSESRSNPDAGPGPKKIYANGNNHKLFAKMPLEMDKNIISFQPLFKVCWVKTRIRIHTSAYNRGNNFSSSKLRVIPPLPYMFFTSHTYPKIISAITSQNSLYFFAFLLGPIFFFFFFFTLSPIPPFSLGENSEKKKTNRNK